MAIFEIAHAKDIAPGGALRVLVSGMPVALFNAHGELFAIADTCTHEDYSLAEGEVEEAGGCCAVECALHGARFDLRSGAALNLPAVLPVDTFRVWIEDDTVKLEIPDELADSVA